ncbi:hypothetical protein AAJP47_00935 [Psychrobacter sp. B38]|uniref:hypothetical protein n=1 Tax=Psychrobacter sp. B38 TaxID=3143538 RepID=UPI00320CAF87
MNAKLLIFFILIALIPSLFFIRSVYVLSDHHIKQCHWKGFGSDVMGDGFSFENNVQLGDGLIRIDNQPTAQIVLRKYRPYADNIIAVSNVKSLELGMYYEKGCS